MSRNFIDGLVGEQIALNAFYHASHEPMPVGAEIKARPPAQDEPNLVDDVRPAGMAPRWGNFFMVDDEGLDCLSNLGQQAGQYLYRVTPTSKTVKADYGWLVFVNAEESDRGQRKYAKSYWSGEPSGIPCQTEYLTGSIRVDEHVGFTKPAGLKLSSEHTYAPNGAKLAGVLGDEVYFAFQTLHAADFRGASLRAADFSSAVLVGAQFDGASLNGASLYRAALRRASLRNADLRGADLQYADLTGADITGADFTGAHRRVADPPIPGWRVSFGQLERDL